MSYSPQCASTTVLPVDRSAGEAGRQPLSWECVVHRLLEQVREWELAPGELQRLVVPVAEADPVAWLHVNPWAERSYWSDRDQRLEIGGIGQAVCLSASTSAEYPQLLERAHALASAADAGLLCAFAFDEAPGRDHWHGFPAAVALLPAIELRREHRQLQLAVNLYAESAAEFVRHKTRLIELLGRLQAPPACISAEQSAGVQVLLRRDELDYAACKAHILAILDEIEAGGIHKAVLARQVELQLAEELPAFATLARWQRISPGSFSFAIEYAGRLFMGCSPERLFRREGQEVLTESLAGTVRRGDTLEEDRSLEAALRNDAKLVREHDWVTRYIEGELTPWVTRTEAPAQAGVLKLDRIQHRHLPIRATLKEGVGDLELLQALHPTPAVCGFPRREAHELIARHERVQRGWYSGAIGVIAPRVSELAVAIRSVLVAGDRAWCYSGVGIVEGSDPEVEWQELEAKIESFLAAVKG